MLFRLKFSDGKTDEFEIPDDDLKKHPDTMLATMCKPAWAGSGPTDVFVLQSVDVTEASWSDGMADMVAAWYAGEGGTVVSGVELADWVAIADWLLVPLGDLDALEYENTEETDFAREVRAKGFLKGRKNLLKAVAHMKKVITNQAATKCKFGFLLDSDNLAYINKCLSEPLLQVGVKYGNTTEYGSPGDAYHWAQDEMLQAECTRMLEASGLKCKWGSGYLELSGTRGMEFPNHDVDAVHGHRNTLLVTVPPAEPASKRRRRAA